jgi:hypothetical protein
LGRDGYNQLLGNNAKNEENMPEEDICMVPSTFCVDHCVNPCKKIAGTMRFCCQTVFLGRFGDLIAGNN